MRIEGRFDAVIVGAGVVGSAIAMALGERGMRALVLDIDLSGRLSSSEKNAGGVRATWWHRVNIALCRASIEYYERIRDEVGLRQRGYLWLYDDATWLRALEHIPLQRELGHTIEALSPAEVKRRVPEIDRLDTVAGATFSPRDGLINPNLLKEHYRRRAIERGASFVDRTFVMNLDADASRAHLECWQSDKRLDDAGLMRMMTQDEAGEAATGELFEVNATNVVIAGGAWSPASLESLKLENFSQAVRRSLCIIDNRTTNLAKYGMIVDTSGVYLHNDGAHILAGYSPPDTPAGYHFEYEGAPFFEREIWPRLYARMSCMERVRHLSGWSGLYELSRDRSAIVGRARAQVYEAHSFSGRGVMQSYGAAQALADLIAFGHYHALDASALSRDRFAQGREIREDLHI